MIKTINRTYRFRIYPNAPQMELLAKHFGCTRFVYNYFLSQRQKQYKEKGVSDNYYAQSRALTELKKQEETARLKEVNSQTLQFALRNLKLHTLTSSKRERSFLTITQRKVRIHLPYLNLQLLKMVNCGYLNSRVVYLSACIEK